MGLITAGSDGYERFPIEFIALGRVKTERELLIFHLNLARAKVKGFSFGCGEILPVDGRWRPWTGGPDWDWRRMWRNICDERGFIAT